jgi:FkbH-like protein
MNVQLICSSFLPPKNKAWRNLNSVENLNFGEYGNIVPGIYSCNKSDALIIIIFSGDLISANKNYSNDLLKVLTPIFDSLKSRLNSSNSPTILAYCSDIAYNSIEHSREFSDNEVFEKIFHDEINNLLSSHPNFFRLNLNILFSKSGYINYFDNRNWYFARSRLSTDGLDIVSKAINQILSRLIKSEKKLLVLDCDNTLWGGVVGEDGVSSLTLGLDGLGMAFVDFQRAILHLKNRGTLLALSSKNNEDEVWKVFQSHTDMVISKDDLVAWEINWDEKHLNIQNLAAALDIGLDSVVFWDDNPLERAKIKEFLPQVDTITPPDNVIDWADHLKSLPQLSKIRITKEDLEKNQQYKNRAKFVQDKKQVKDPISYLKSINLLPMALEISPNRVPRAAQLLNKTNQFNLRSIRRSESELIDFLENKSTTELSFAVSLEDIYGDHGVIGLVCTQILSPKIAFLDSFLMSCRVLGRYVEFWMINQLIKKLVLLKYDYIAIECCSNERNLIAQNFYKEICAHNIPSEDPTLISTLGDISGKSENYTAFNLINFKIPYLEIFDK